MSGGARVRVVIPVHDEGPHLAGLLDALVALAPAADAPPTELVVVDDGSRPAMARRHAEAVAAAAARLAARGTPHRLRLVQAPENQGKGAAIRLGWGDGAAAAWLGFVDGDGAVPAAEVWRLVAQLRGDPPFDGLLGARIRGAGRDLRRTRLRDLQGRVFSATARAVLGLRLHDPQCGLKLLRAACVRPVLGELREMRWLLDLELLLLLGRAGARLREAPIDWRETGRSKVKLGIDQARMLIGVWGLRRRLGRWAGG